MSRILPKYLLWPVILATVFWAALSAAHLYCFALPWADTWAYVSPAVTAPYPFKIHLPMLGDFHGADHAWGLQWPGSILLNSLILSVVPFHPAVTVSWTLLNWLVIAALAGFLVQRTIGSDLLATVAYIYCLSDRSFFFIAYAQRMELMTLIVFCAVLLAANQWLRDGLKIRAQIGTGLGILLLPLLHPLGIVAGGAVCLVCFWSAPNKFRFRNAPVFWGMCFVLGLILLVSWFLSQPSALDQFRDHASSRIKTSGPGMIFIKALRDFYGPLPIGPLISIGTLVAALYTLYKERTFWSHPTSTAAPKVLLGFSCVTLFVAFNLFENTNYLPLAIIPGLPLGLAGAQAVIGSCSRPGLRRIFAISIIGLFLACQIAPWASRTLKYAKSGWANFRPEMISFLADIPEAKTVVIPETMWEAALQLGKPVLLNTLPQAASPQRRAEYLTYLQDKIDVGDIVIIDKYQTFPSDLKLSNDNWELIASTERTIPGVVTWGYGLTAWRKVGSKK